MIEHAKERPAPKQDYMLLHVDLFVRSMTKALDFYCTKLGFSVVEDQVLRGPLARIVSRDTHDALRLVLLRSPTGGAMIELQEFLAESALPPIAAQLRSRQRTAWLSILVPDLRALMDRMHKHDVLPVSDVFTVKLRNSRPCDLVLYQDPDGNDLEFVQLRPGP
jgi:catechol 2,3-dioxygenase-like lactoylglutathione lyase family enzyme